MIDDIQLNPNGAGGELAIVPEELPTFDFSELSWGDSLALTKVQTTILELTQLQDKMTAEDAQRLGEAFVGITEHLAIITRTVPRHWLVSRAPEHLDFSDPLSFDWVKQKYIGKLMKAMTDAQVAEKNE